MPQCRSATRTTSCGQSIRSTASSRRASSPRRTSRTPSRAWPAGCTRWPERAGDIGGSDAPLAPPLPARGERWSKWLSRALIVHPSSAAAVLRPPRDQRLAVELAALGAGQRVAQQDALGYLEGRHYHAAIANELVGIEADAGPRHHEAHHLLAIDRVGDSHGRDVDDVCPLHQQAVDLERRDIDAAANDQFLLAPGHVQVTVGVEEAQIAGLEAPAAVDRDRPVFAEVAVLVVGEPAQLDAAALTGLERPSVAIDDAEAVIGERLADSADAPALARVGRDPAGLAAAITLRDANAEPFLEASPVLGQKRRRARGDESQARHVGIEVLAVEQHAERGRIAGGDRGAVGPDMREEPTARELLRDDHGGATLERRKDAQGLGRAPVERAEVIDAVVAAKPEAGGGRRRIGEELAERQHHALGPRAGSRREQDDGIAAAAGARRRKCVGCLVSIDGAAKRIAAGTVVPAADGETRRRHGGQ